MIRQSLRYEKKLFKETGEVKEIEKPRRHKKRRQNEVKEERQRREGEKDLTAICHLDNFSFVFVYKMSHLHQGKHHRHSTF